MYIKCDFEDCGYEWDYNGKRKGRACCPDCGRQLTLCKECIYEYKNGIRTLKTRCKECQTLVKPKEKKVVISK